MVRAVEEPGELGDAGEPCAPFTRPDCDRRCDAGEAVSMRWVLPVLRRSLGRPCWAVKGTCPCLITDTCSQPLLATGPTTGIDARLEGLGAIST